MHERLAELYTDAEAGALDWALGGGGRIPAAPDLRRRFIATERRLDELGQGGGTDAALDAAAEAHLAVWLDIVRRWQRWAAADRPARGAA